MAERIDSLPERAGRPPTYPWAEWMDGSAWRIVRGEDFEVEAVTMAAMIRNRARDARTSARAYVDGDAVEFQFAAKAAA